MIKQKTGICIDCPKGSSEVPLTAKRCKNHYWQYRSKVNASKLKNREKTKGKQVFGTFFASQVVKLPTHCEECEALLPTSPSWMRRACVAHILPKRPDFGFPSVAIHPVNKAFLCPDCHSNMDSLGDKFILKMKLLPTLKERVKILIPLLTDQELKRVPEYYL